MSKEEAAVERSIRAPMVEIVIGHRRFTLTLNEREAPVSVAYFLQGIDTGVLDDATVFRIVNLNNQPPGNENNIEVVQMGLWNPNSDMQPVIAHESTRSTGLRHRRGTVSLARYAPGAVYYSFFVCMRDEPVLDFGGLRNPDGLGFAAFGFVSEGFESLEGLYMEHANTPEFLPTPIRFTSIRRVV